MNANDVTFGVEIECAIPVQAVREAGWVTGSYHRGITLPGFPNWEGQSDSSIQAPSGHVAIEVVSRVLKGAEGMAEVRSMCQKLTAMGAKVGRRVNGGLHVHVGFTGAEATADALRRLINLTANHEAGLFAVTGSKWREANHYCASIKGRHSDARVNRLKARTRTSVTDVADLHTARMQTLNLTNLGAYGGKPTVEFRVFDGSCSAIKVTSYVALCIGLVQKAMNSKGTVRFDAETPNRTPEGKLTTHGRTADGMGELEALRLMWSLGWWGGRTRYGVVEGADLKPMIAELLRLARKYDAPVPSPAVTAAIDASTGIAR